MAKGYGGYPQSATNRAKAALKHKEEKGTSCGTSVGWARARQLAERRSLDLSTVKRTFSFLSRAKTYDQGKFTDADGKDICGSIMYAAWGGDGMKRWCESTIKKAEKKHMKKDLELRSIDSSFEVRTQESTGKVVVEGYAARFNDETVIGGAFAERIDKNAFQNSDMSNTVALFNHNWDQPLSRAGKGLHLEVDEVGLKYRFELGNQSYAKDLEENIRSGNVSTSSFGFTIKDDEWEKRSDGMNLRTVKSVDVLYDVSPTTQGAYPTTEVGLRSMELAFRAQEDEEEEEDMVEESEEATEEKESKASYEGDSEDSDNEDDDTAARAEGDEEEEEEEELRKLAESETEIELVDQSILPHPYGLATDRKQKNEPEARTAKKMENTEKNAPAYIQGRGDSEASVASRFSFGKMIKEAAQGRLTGLEAEINQEGRSEFSNGKVNVAGGICIPSFVLNRDDAPPLGVTAGASSSTSQFGGAIGIDDNGIVEAFAPNDIASQLGVRNLNNLTGDVVFQVQDTKMSADKPAEGVVQESANPSFSSVKLQPQRYSAHTKVTDQMLAQSAQDMGAFLAMDIRRAVDAKFNTDIVTAISEHADNHADTPGTLDSYSVDTLNPMHLEENLLGRDVDLEGVVALSSAKAYRVFRELSHDAGSGLLFAQTPLERRNVIGYPTVISSSVTAGEFFMFHREQLITGTWGGLNLIIDPYSEADYGVTRIVANVYRDVKALQEDAFDGMQSVGA